MKKTAMSLLICTTLLSTSFSTSVLAQGQNADQGITTEQKMEKPSTLQLLQAKQKIQMVVFFLLILYQILLLLLSNMI